MARDGARVHLSVVVNDELVSHITFNRDANGRLQRFDGAVYDSLSSMLTHHRDHTDAILPCPLNRMLSFTG